MFLQRNVASQTFVVPGTLRAVADGSAVASGSLTVVKDGTSAAAAGTLAHISDGAFKYTPTQGETDCKIFGYVLTGAGAVAVCGSIRTTNADPNDAAALGLTRVDAAITSRSSHTAADVWTSGTRTLSSGTNIVLAKGTGVTGFNDIAAADVWAVATRTLTAFSFSVTVGTNNDKTGYALTAGEHTAVAADVLGAIASSYNAAGTIGQKINAAGSAGDPWTTDISTGYTGNQAGAIVYGNLDAKVSTRSMYAGGDTSGTITLLNRLTSGRAGNLDNLDSAVSTRAPESGGNVAAIRARTDLIPAQPAAVGSAMTLAPGAIVAASFGAGAIDSAAIATDALTNAELSASAVAEIITAVWSEAIPGSYPAGSAANKLNAAGNAGDPWGTLLPGSYADGTAGNIVGGFADTVPLSDIADAILDRTDAVETGETPRNLFRRLRAVLAGAFNKTDTPGTFVFNRKDGTTEAFRTANDSQGNRISSTDGTL